MPFFGLPAVEGLLWVSDFVVRVFPGEAPAVVGGCSPGLAAGLVADDMADVTSRGGFAGDELELLMKTASYQIATDVMMNQVT